MQAGQKGEQEVLTTNSGAPIGDNTNSLTAGVRGPVLMEDFRLLEKLGQFDREKIPERIVHARGAAAFGEFEVTSDALKDLTDANMFQKAGTKVPVQVRLLRAHLTRCENKSILEFHFFAASCVHTVPAMQCVRDA